MGQAKLRQPEFTPEPENEKKKETLRFRKDTSVEMHAPGIKALEAFKQRFLLGKKNIPDLKILMVNTGNDVSVMDVFPESKITFVEETRGDAERLTRLGLHAFKADYRVRQEFSDPGSDENIKGGFDVVVILDPNAEPSPKFLTTIKGEGWILCRARMAGALRGTGDYEVKGVIGRDGPAPTLAKGPHGEMWGEVTTDKEFMGMSGKKTPDVVTYDEAIGALKAAGMEEKEVKNIVARERVLEEYRKLLNKKSDLKGIPWKEEDKSLIFVLRKSGAFAH